MMRQLCFAFLSLLPVEALINNGPKLWDLHPINPPADEISRPPPVDPELQKLADFWGKDATETKKEGDAAQSFAIADAKEVLQRPKRLQEIQHMIMANFYFFEKGEDLQEFVKPVMRCVREQKAINDVAKTLVNAIEQCFVSKPGKDHDGLTRESVERMIEVGLLQSALGMLIPSELGHITMYLIERQTWHCIDKATAAAEGRPLRKDFQFGTA